MVCIKNHYVQGHLNHRCIGSFMYKSPRVTLKGQCHRWILLYFKGLNILISTFCVCADGLLGISKAFHYPIQLLTFYLLLWNYLLILKMLNVTLLRIPFSVIGRCSLVPTSHWLQGKCAAAFGIILQNHRRLPVSIYKVKIASLGSLKRVTERRSKLVSNFKGTS
jgi:hypothetical protein